MTQTKQRFERYFARKFSAARFELVARVFFSDFMKSAFNAQIKDTLVIPEHGNHAIYYVPAQWTIFQNRIYRKVFHDRSSFRRYARMITISERRYGSFGLALPRQLSQLPLTRLHRLWTQFDAVHLDFFNKAIWIPFSIEPLSSADAETILQQLWPPVRQRQEYERGLEIVFGQEKLNAITSQELHLLTVAIHSHQSRREGQRALQRHIKQFAFIPCYDVSDRPWDEKHFSSELAKMRRRSMATLQAERAAIRQRPLAVQKSFRRLLNDRRLSKRQRDQLWMAHELTFIKDERDDYRRLGSFRIKPLYAELDRRLGYPPNGSLYLVRDEMETFFQTGRHPDRELIIQRMKGYGLIRQSPKPMQIVSGRALRQLIRQELGNRTVERVKQFSGTVGSVGQATGRARIVITKHDLRRMKNGEVLVAVTTHPDFVPAMKKAVAIVTDEGGITSHAAIVSRELKIPCIVGAKIATASLQDGDRVSVDAQRGIVRKLLSS